MGVAVSRWWTGAAGSVLMIVAGWVPHAAVAASAVAQLNPQPFVSRLPLTFEPNHGQDDSRVWFVSRDPGYSLYLTARGAVLGLSGSVRPVKLNWLGAAGGQRAQGESLLSAKYNVMHGNDPKRWRFNLPTYAKVHYRDLYPGVDLIYYGRQRHLEYDLVVAPGADPAVIRLRVTGVNGLKLDDGGALRLQVQGRPLILDTPIIYQQTAAGKQPVKGGYVLLADDEVGFRLGTYDHSRPLIIDPVLSYAGFLGGSGLDQGKGVAVDGSGNIYIVGQTASADFPTNATTKTGTDTDVFVSKFDAAGMLLATSFLGGAGTDRGYAIAVDDAHSAVYLTGDTDSVDFPVTDATTNNGDIDAFVAKLNSADLSPDFSTYLGGTLAEEALGIAVDGSGNAYAAGATLSGDFPNTTSSKFNLGNTGNHCDDPSHPGTLIPCSDAYVTKFNSAGVIQYSTFLGGYFEDAANAIAVDATTGEAYVTGITYSTDLPVGTAGFQKSHAGGFGDAFILKLTSTGTVGYGTYLGGGGWDQGQAIALDGSGNIYVAGATNSGSNSTSLPVPTASVQRQFGGGTYDAFVAKINPTNAASSQLQYLTYLGGSSKDFAFGIAADNSGNAYVVGETTSMDFPLQSPLQSTWFGKGTNQWGDAFVTKIDNSGFLLDWSTYLGGADDDWANGVALDGSSGIYVVGSSYSTDFPTVNPYQGTNAGGSDAVLVKLTDSALTTDLQVSVSASPDPVGSGETLTYQVVVTNLNTSNAATGVVITATLPNGVSYQSATPAGGCSAAGSQVTCSLGSIAADGSTSITLATVSNTAGDITFTAKVVRASQPDPDVSNNSASITTKAAVGGGGGAWSLYGLAAMLLVSAFRARHGVIEHQS